MLEDLCEALVAVLDVSAPGFLHSVPAAMQALSSIGRVAPAVFAQHAAAVADFVLEVTKQALLLSFILDSEWLTHAGHTCLLWPVFRCALCLHWPLSLVAEPAL